MLQFEEEEDIGLIPFRFSPLWVDCAGFMNIVSQAWSRPVIGSPNFVWEQKLKFTKLALKDWPKQNVKSPSNDKIEALKVVEELQVEMNETRITLAKLEKEQQA